MVGFNEIPDDVKGLIFSQLPLDNLSQVKDVDNIGKEVYHKHLSSLKRIQRTIKRNRISWDAYEAETDLEKRKQMLVRLYITTYPEEDLYYYPHFLAEKMRRLDLQEWIKKNPIKTRRDVKTFLNLEGVSEYDISYTGW